MARLRSDPASSESGAGKCPAPSPPRPWVGRAVALVAVASAIGLGAYSIDRLHRSPRTEDAFLYADSIGLAPDVSGRIVRLDAHDNA